MENGILFIKTNSYKHVINQFGVHVFFTSIENYDRAIKKCKEVEDPTNIDSESQDELMDLSDEEEEEGMLSITYHCSLIVMFIRYDYITFSYNIELCFVFSHLYQLLIINLIEHESRHQ